MTKDELLFDPHDVLGPQDAFDEDVQLKNIGQMGYFANTLVDLNEAIKQRRAYKLLAIQTDNILNHMYRYDGTLGVTGSDLFLPLIKAKHPEPQRRPCYSAWDFTRAAHIINMWDSFVFRARVEPEEFIHAQLIKCVEHRGKNDRVTSWNIGGISFKPEYLFEHYEVKDPETGKWHPFGVIMTPEEIAAEAGGKTVLDAQEEDDTKKMAGLWRDSVFGGRDKGSEAQEEGDEAKPAVFLAKDAIGNEYATSKEAEE